MKWLNPLHHFSGCSKVGGGFLKNKVLGFRILLFTRIFSEIFNKNSTGPTRAKKMMEYVMSFRCLFIFSCCCFFIDSFALFMSFSFYVNTFEAGSQYSSQYASQYFLLIQPDSIRINLDWKINLAITLLKHFTPDYWCWPWVFEVWLS